MAQLDNRKRAYLDAMGIDIWLPSQASVSPEMAVPASATAHEPVLADPEPALATQPVQVKTQEQAVDVQPALNIATMDWTTLQDTVANCTLCELHKTRTQTVFGVGNPEADLLIIGEAPGADEDKQGEPFVGRAGQLLNAMLKAIGFERSDVYIANILKCRPPQNRDPSAEEAEACWPYLQRQIELIQPRVILALGRIAAQRLLKTNASLARLRGKQHYLEEINVPMVVTYHPAYLLRSPQEKRKAWEDLQFLMDKLTESR
jgi:DNA polymerase